MLSPHQNPSLPLRTATKTFTKPSLLFAAGFSVALLLLSLPFPSSLSAIPRNHNPPTTPLKDTGHAQDTNLNFYDDPNLSYTLQNPIKDWDFKRRKWLSQHPNFSAGAADRILVLTGSQPSPCKNPIGDHLLLRFFKNKVDYCRINGYDLFYNTALLELKMAHYWAKLPVVRAAMVAHPEAEWVWWVDSDAAFTDMDFRLPLAKYADHNLVVHGWPEAVYGKKSWVGLNAGVFLIRNCQWSMDFMAEWARMGPQSSEYEKWGKIQRSILKDKMYPQSDDQSALVYFLLEEKEKWGEKIFLESDFYFQGYWEEVVRTLVNVTDENRGLELRVRMLRRRHAEKEHVKWWGRGVRRPFITHFTGCQPCSGDYNKQMYTWQRCKEGMEMALNFADDQVLRAYGFGREGLLDDGMVVPREYDFPGGKMNKR